MVSYGPVIPLYSVLIILLTSVEFIHIFQGLELRGSPNFHIHSGAMGKIFQVLESESYKIKMLSPEGINREKL